MVFNLLIFIVCFIGVVYIELFIAGNRFRWVLIVLASLYSLMGAFLITNIYLLLGAFLSLILFANLIKTPDNILTRHALKLSKLFSLLFGVCILLSLLSTLLSIPILPAYSMLAGLMFLALMYFFNKFLPKTKPSDDSLVEKVKSDLGIGHVKQIKMKFIKPFRWVGGLVMPMFPSFTLINTGWKKRLNDEAIIHENAHIHLMLHKYWIAYLLGIPMVAAITLLVLFDLSPSFIILVGMVLMMVTFEKHTFYLTNKIGDKCGIITREWSWSIAVKYLIIYTLQICVVLSIFYGVQMLVGWILK